LYLSIEGDVKKNGAKGIRPESDKRQLVLACAWQK